MRWWPLLLTVVSATLADDCQREFFAQPVIYDRAMSIDIYYTAINLPSVAACAAFCGDRHFCRTAVYNIFAKTCAISYEYTLNCRYNDKRVKEFNTKNSTSNLIQIACVTKCNEQTRLARRPKISTEPEEYPKIPVTLKKVEIVTGEPNDGVRLSPPKLGRSRSMQARDFADPGFLNKLIIENLTSILPVLDSRHTIRRRGQTCFRLRERKFLLGADFETHKGVDLPSCRCLCAATYEKDRPKLCKSFNWRVDGTCELNIGNELGKYDLIDDHRYTYQFIDCEPNVLMNIAKRLCKDGKAVTYLPGITTTQAACSKTLGETTTPESTTSVTTSTEEPSTTSVDTTTEKKQSTQEVVTEATTTTEATTEKATETTTEASTVTSASATTTEEQTTLTEAKTTEATTVTTTKEATTTDVITQAPTTSAEIATTTDSVTSTETPITSEPTTESTTTEVTTTVTTTEAPTTTEASTEATTEASTTAAKETTVVTEPSTTTLLETTTEPLNIEHSDCFERISRHMMTSFAAALEHDVSIKECECFCANSRASGRHGFDCTSATYYHGERDCVLNIEDRQEKPKFFSVQASEFNVTYLGLTCPREKAISQLVDSEKTYGCRNVAKATHSKKSKNKGVYSDACFVELPSYVLEGTALHVETNATPQQCKCLCAAAEHKFGEACQSFQYYYEGATCLLSKHNRFSSPENFNFVSNSQPRSYFEYKCATKEERLKKYADQFCEGENKSDDAPKTNVTQDDVWASSREEGTNSTTTELPTSSEESTTPAESTTSTEASTAISSTLSTTVPPKKRRRVVKINRWIPETEGLEENDFMGLDNDLASELEDPMPSPSLKARGVKTVKFTDKIDKSAQEDPTTSTTTTTTTTTTRAPTMTTTLKPTTTTPAASTYPPAGKCTYSALYQTAFFGRRVLKTVAVKNAADCFAACFALHCRSANLIAQGALNQCELFRDSLIDYRRPDMIGYDGSTVYFDGIRCDGV